eukprot:TRINITY_DN7270_c0_g1_i5.p1 TRINITY_DN7270_c0_g1~~TRINITY_DN7270_c0_g1_i5.p1  ORF type:complete len:534 (-),score=166.34 TRINITY_DN7270_c0_g1_i5:955-2556(-)
MSEDGRREGLIWSKLDGGNWSKLWFSLRMNKLHYRLDPEIKTDLGSLEVFGSTIKKIIDPNSFRKNLFEIELKDEEKHLFSCISEEELELWVNSLNFSAQNKFIPPKSPPPALPPKLNEIQKARLKSALNSPNTSSGNLRKMVRGFSKKILYLPLPPSLPPWETVEPLVMDPVSGEPRVATVEKLIERIYGTNSAVTKYLGYFLLTFKTFTTSNVLLKSLIDAFWKVEDESPEKTHPNRLKICIFLKKWLNESYNDFGDNPQLLQQFNAFSDAIDEKLASTLKRKMSVSQEHSGFDVPEPLTPVKNNSFGFDLVEPQELAKQLTLRVSKLFRSIPPEDFLDLHWKQDPNCKLSRFLSIHDKITQWVIQEIVNSPVEKRPNKYKKWIKVGDEAHELSDWDLTFAIMKGLQSEEVLKVKGNETWTHADVHFQAFEELKNTVNPRNNYKNYREALSKCNRQCVPWLALPLKEISDLEEDNPTKLSGGLINFKKCVEMAKILEEIIMKQQMRYTQINSNQDIQYWFSQVLQDKGSFL